MGFTRLDLSVPENYVSESRDFQTLIRLLTAAQANARQNADSLRYLNNPLLINNRLLTLLATKVGFFTQKTFREELLRYTLDVFYYLVRNKGSKLSIEKSIRLYFKVINKSSEYYIDIDNSKRVINIGLKTDPQDIDLLLEIFRFIMPAGYFTHINFYNDYMLQTKYSEHIKWTYYNAEEENAELLTKAQIDEEAGSYQGENSILHAVDTMDLRVNGVNENE